MDMLKGIGSQLGSHLEKHAKGITAKLTTLKDNYLGAVYELPRYRVAVKRLIAEGGFGFVFFVTEIGTERPFALKRMVVQERERLKVIKNEVDTMRLLSKSRNIVKLEDFKIIEGFGGGRDAEVLVLMEYCSWSLYGIQGVIHAFQNSSLNEKEILKIFSQICAGVEFMHGQQPPIAHRDLKVENVLYQENDKLFKLCDFGSATTVTYLPTNERERSVAEEDINRNTTMTYRSPEMVDLYLKHRINEKADIWALGCILYKMAFNKDPFEEGRLAILNAKYVIPDFHKFSPTYIEFIAYLLNLDPQKRPDIYQVQEKLATIRGVQYKKQFVPTKPLPTTPGAQPVQAAPSVQPVQAQQPQPQRSAQQPQSAKSIFDSLTWEQGDSVTHNPAKQPRQQPQNTQQPSQNAQIPANSTSVPKHAAADDLLNWDTTQTHNHNTASVPNTKPNQPPSGNFAPAGPTKAFSFDWVDSPPPTKPTNNNTIQRTATPPSVKSEPAAPKPSANLIDDFDPFSQSVQPQPTTQPQQYSTAIPETDNTPKSASDPDDFLSFDDPQPNSAQKTSLPGLAGLNLNNTSIYYPPGYKQAPGAYGARPFYSPQPPPHQHAQPVFHSPQPPHHFQQPVPGVPPGAFGKQAPGFPPGYGYKQPPQPAYPAFGRGGVGAPGVVAGVPGAPGVGVGVTLPTFNKLTRSTGDIDDFDPLAPGAQTHNNTTPTNTQPTTTTTAKKASDMIDFF